MRSILAACLTTAGAARAHVVATAIAARTGATIRWTTPEAAAGDLPFSPDAAPDLLVVSPRAAESATWLGYDRATSSLLRRADEAVLVIRGPVDWPPRRVLLPVSRSDLERGTVPAAAGWIARLCGGQGTPSVDLTVLHLAEDPDELHSDRGLVEGQIDGLRERDDPTLDVRLAHCTRFGAHPWKRILVRLAHESPTLTILDRGETGARPGAVQQAWFHLTGRADSPVLLLPRASASPVAGRDVARVLELRPDVPRTAPDEWLPPMPA